VARTSRHSLGRTVRYVVVDQGIRQFLDIGTGLPTADNTHEVAQRLAPDARIVYVDNDPMVLAHARALLTSAPEGGTAYLDADLYETDAILKAAAGTLDFSRPVALMISTRSAMSPTTTGRACWSPGSRTAFRRAVTSSSVTAPPPARA
jgi:hypothetical protein